MTTWRYFARRELPRVVRDLRLPAVLSVRDPALTRCPLHNVPLGSVSRMCQHCHDACWAEIGRRYVEQGRPTKTNLKGEPWSP